MKKKIMTAILSILICSVPALAELSPMEQLGKNIFFDKNLSQPVGQSCASCHDPGFGLAGRGGAGDRPQASDGHARHAGPSRPERPGDR